MAQYEQVYCETCERVEPLAEARKTGWRVGAIIRPALGRGVTYLASCPDCLYADVKGERVDA